MHSSEDTQGEPETNWSCIVTIHIEDSLIKSGTEWTCGLPRMLHHRFPSRDSTIVKSACLSLHIVTISDDLMHHLAESAYFTTAARPIPPAMSVAHVSGSSIIEHQLDILPLVPQSRRTSLGSSAEGRLVQTDCGSPVSTAREGAQGPACMLHVGSGDVTTQTFRTPLS